MSCNPDCLKNAHIIPFQSNAILKCNANSFVTVLKFLYGLVPFLACTVLFSSFPYLHQAFPFTRKFYFQGKRELQCYFPGIPKKHTSWKTPGKLDVLIKEKKTYLISWDSRLFSHGNTTFKKAGNPWKAGTGNPGK
jgi:hypothetical protein